LFVHVAFLSFCSSLIEISLQYEQWLKELMVLVEVAALAQPLLCSAEE
jgi:hypothetical protein